MPLEAEKIDNESVYVKPSSFDQYNKTNELIGEKDAFDEGQEDTIVSLITEHIDFFICWFLKK